MKAWLYPGAKVVCVKPWRGSLTHEPLVKGKIYTVREIILKHGTHGDPGCCLAEIINPRANDRFEYGYPATWFRPLTKRSTDAEVSKLKRLLNTTPADLESV